MRPPVLLCLGLVLMSGIRAEDWPQWQGVRRDGTWNETGLLEKFPEGGPKVLWRKPVHAGYAGPAVVAGKVYVCDYLVNGAAAADPNKRGVLQGEERISCLDAKNGEQLWEYKYA